MNHSDTETEGYRATGWILQRYSITRVSLTHWLTNASIGFPQPALRVGGRRLWSIADVIRWEEQKANNKRVAA